MCLDCGGLWLSAESLTETFPELVQTVARSGASEGRRVPCPACGDAMVNFIVEDLALDACRKCIGLWIDAKEIQPLEAARAKLGSELDAARGYRDSGRTELATPSVACDDCGKSLAPSRVVERDGRRLCRVCDEIRRDPLEVPTSAFGKILRWARLD
jgi:Zn-finger nucleic acid-binding protein